MTNWSKLCLSYASEYDRLPLIAVKGKQATGKSYTSTEGVSMAIRFLWNATRGHRFTPWRSEYLKWRIETYSGRKADTIDASYFWLFVWKEKGQLLRFLGWTRNYGTRRRQST